MLSTKTLPETIKTSKHSWKMNIPGNMNTSLSIKIKPSHYCIFFFNFLKINACSLRLRCKNTPYSTYLENWLLHVGVLGTEKKKKRFNKMYLESCQCVVWTSVNSVCFFQLFRFCSATLLHCVNFTKYFKYLNCNCNIFSCLQKVLLKFDNLFN